MPTTTDEYRADLGPVDSESTVSDAMRAVDAIFDGDYNTDADNDPAHRNAQRAGRGVAVLQAYGNVGGADDATSIRTVLTDLLGDLRHTADALGVDIDWLMIRATSHHEAELRGE